MPNKRANRRKKFRPSKPKGKKNNKLEPSDIDKMIRELNSSQTPAEVVKFLTYILERKVYKYDCNKEFIGFCLSSYFILKNKYAMFCLMFDLPTMEFLQEEALKDVNFSPGLAEPVLELLKIKTENYEPLAKICILILDEVALKPEVKYCHEHDHTVGFEDDGHERTDLPAQFVTNIWVQCLGGQWLVPFSYYCTNTSCPVNKLKKYLFEAVTKLDGIGLNVIGVVTKMRTNFYELAQTLDISSTNQSFKVGNKEVVFLFDVPQLMNITRNNLMKYTLKFNEMSTSWKHVKQLFFYENQGERNTQLTLAHIKPDKNHRSRPVLAIQLLSNSVATAMQSLISQEKLPESAAGTARFIELFNRLFDVLNSSKEISMNEYCNAYKGTKSQVKFLEDIIKLFEDLKVFDSADQDCTGQVKFIKGWLISIKGVMKMWEMLNDKAYPFLLTRNVNCEALDKFIWLLCWQLFTFRDPTPVAFLDLYTSVFAPYYFEEHPTDDCEFDIVEYAKAVFKRIPAVQHDITLKGSLPNNNELACSTSQHQCPAVDDMFQEFMKIFLDMIGLQ